MKNPEIIIYTDGSSRGNPGLGGWAAIIMTDTDVVEIAGSQRVATNNQMELMAVESALSYVRNHDASQYVGAELFVHADSAYVLNGLQSWLDGWVRNGWMTSAKKPVENRTQWEALRELRDFFGNRLVLVKVAGHSGHAYNDRCDEIAVSAALAKSSDELQSVLFSGTRKEYEAMLGAAAPAKLSAEKKSSSTSSGKKPYSYVSFVDGVAHADATWAACESRVKGKKNAKFKKVFSKAEEASLIQDYTLSSLL